MSPSNQGRISADQQRRALARARSWAATRTHSVNEYPLERFAALKESARASVSVVIPAKEVAETIADVVASCAALRDRGAVDEVIVVDADSADGTAARAEAAGAEVRSESALLAQYGEVLGKGDALWRALSAVNGDVVVFVDGDTDGFSEQFVTGLAGPLLEDAQLQLVKGAFRRPFTADGTRVADAGGRVNELMARPLLNAHFPELAGVNQPLAGEIAARRSALAQLPFCTGYGVEIQLLIDIYLRFGLDAIAQTQLGERLNRHQALHDLGPMAFAVLRAVLARAGEAGVAYADRPEYLGYVAGEPALRETPLTERPPANLLEPTGAGTVSAGAFKKDAGDGA